MHCLRRRPCRCLPPPLQAALVFGLWRNEIALASRLLGLSAHGLAANPGIITATILLNIGSVLAILPLAVLSGECCVAGWLCSWLACELCWLCGCPAAHGCAAVGGCSIPQLTGLKP